MTDHPDRIELVEQGAAAPFMLAAAFHPAQPSLLLFGIKRRDGTRTTRVYLNAEQATQLTRWLQSKITSME